MTTPPSKHHTANAPTTAALIVAAGAGVRASAAIPKQYAVIAGKALLAHTLARFVDHPQIAQVQVVIGAGQEKLYKQAVQGITSSKLLPPVTGGETRQESVKAGLEALSHSAPERVPALVLIHDAARPNVSPALISSVIEALGAHPAVLPVVPVVDTLKQVRQNQVERTVDRKGLMRAQTPQGFVFADILAAHRTLTDTYYTDDATMIEALGQPVATVAGEEANIKITTAEDIAMLAQQLATPMETRVGQGIDVHSLIAPLSAGKAKPLILCGVEIPSEKHLEGHSDADVGLHALTDAILGALAEGDIGAHFPPSDPQWKNADSTKFLQFACSRVAARGGRVTHLDVTFICEAPKIAPHREAMRARVAEICGLTLDRVSIKATTTEKMGFTGRGEGIAAQAVATLLLPGV